MSAWIVENGHIDVLVNALVHFGVLPKNLGPNAFREVGQKLWRENHLSVNYRYQENTPTSRYRLHITEADLDPVAVLKAIDCYVYQTCEHPGWKHSEVHDLMGQLRNAIFDQHPELGETVRGRFGIDAGYVILREYDRAPWGFDSLDQASTPAAGHGSP